MLKTLINSTVIKTVVLCATFLCHRHFACFAGEKVIGDSFPTKTLALFDSGTEKLSDAFEKVAKSVKPSLVRIQPCYGDTELNSSFAIPFELDGGTFNSIQTTGSVSVPDRSENPNASHGSGVVVSEDGYIWTSSDVVRDAKTANVILSTGEEFSGRILLVDQDSGLAIVKIEAAGLTPIKLADNLKPRVAEWTMAVGQASDDHPMISTGFVWLKERTTASRSSRGTRVDFFSYTVPGVTIEPGSALVNLQGQLVGIDVPPPLLFKNSSGTRYGLSSDSAFAIWHEISEEVISLADQSTVQNSEVSTRNPADTSGVTKHQPDQLRDRRTNKVKVSEISRHENSPRMLSANWFGVSIEAWLGWLNETLSPSSQVGGMISQ